MKSKEDIIAGPLVHKDISNANVIVNQGLF